MSRQALGPHHSTSKCSGAPAGTPRQTGQDSGARAPCTPAAGVASRSPTTTPDPTRGTSDRSALAPEAARPRLDGRGRQRVVQRQPLVERKRLVEDLRGDERGRRSRCGRRDALDPRRAITPSRLVRNPWRGEVLQREDRARRDARVNVDRARPELAQHPVPGRRRREQLDLRDQSASRSTRLTLSIYASLRRPAGRSRSVSRLRESVPWVVLDPRSKTLRRASR